MIRLIISATHISNSCSLSSEASWRDHHSWCSQGNVSNAQDQIFTASRGSGKGSQCHRASALSRDISDLINIASSLKIDQRASFFSPVLFHFTPSQVIYLLSCHCHHQDSTMRFHTLSPDTELERERERETERASSSRFFL